VVGAIQAVGDEAKDGSCTEDKVLEQGIFRLREEGEKKHQDDLLHALNEV